MAHQPAGAVGLRRARDLLALWSYLAGLDPHDATVLAAHAEGLQRFDGEALAILASESRGKRIGVHRPHRGRVRGCVFWRAAVDAGWLHLGEARALAWRVGVGR